VPDLAIAMSPYVQVVCERAVVAGGLMSFACDRRRLLGPNRQTRWGHTKEANKVAGDRWNVNGAVKGGSHDCGVDKGAAAVDPRGALRQRLPDAEGPSAG
jgi:hypothetical protein